MPTIEMLTVANHAEAVNGLLYLSGAGWDRVTRRYPTGGKPRPHRFGIAVSVLIPWAEANRRHRLSLWVESEDGGDPLVKVDGKLEVGRPPGVPEGSDRRAVLAVEATVEFPRPGGYRIVGEVGGNTRTYSFFVVDDSASRP
jgi:hypothetical protein